MPLKAPNLDDRTYDDLRQMALDHINSQLQADWTDLTPGDPGVMLLEVFAHLTDQLIYRLNRVPQEKVYVALLQLLGVAPHPPAAALVELEFTNLTPQEIIIPAQTQVTAASGGNDAPIFSTLEEVILPAATLVADDSVLDDSALGGSTLDSSTEETDVSEATVSNDALQPSSVRVQARNCQYIAREIFQSTGSPGQTLTVRQPPIIAPTYDNFELLVEVQEGDHYNTWQEVANFNHLTPDSEVYVVDRMAGLIRFAPAIAVTEKAQVENQTGATPLTSTPRPLAAYPLAGAIIRVSYAHSDETRGGVKGNVAANQLTVLLPTPIPGVSVTNPAPAMGGQGAETLANALQRGPQEIYSLERAITARDFERLAARPGTGIQRAKASTQMERWAHGERGAVEIRIVPQLTDPIADIVQLTHERQQAGEQALEIQNLRRVLADSQAMGTAVVLRWAHYKKVWVEAQVTLQDRAALSDVRQRLLPALDGLLAPLPSHNDARRQGWPFGQTLYASDIHRILLEDDGIDAITRLQLCVDAAPNAQVNAIAADHHQPHTWFAASGRHLFRSFNDGEGWEMLSDFPAADPAARAERIRLIAPNPDRAGLVAVWVQQTDSEGVQRFIPIISTDCGESWHRLPSFGGRLEDMAWLAREETPILLLATDQGLYKLELTIHAQAQRGLQLEGTYVAIREMQQPLQAIAVIKKNTQVYVAVALQSRGGVYLANGLFLAYDIEQDWQVDEEDADTQPTPRQIFRPLTSSAGAVQATLQGEDIRYLTVQYEDEADPAQRVWLWAGAMSIGWEGSRRADGDAGRGCFVWEVQTPQPLRGQWAHPAGWMGGSCRGIAFLGDTVLATSQWGGVLHLAYPSTDQPSTSTWQQTNSVVLPRRGADVERNFAPLVAIASNRNRQQPVAVVGGTQGLYVTKDKGITLTDAAQTRFDYRVTLPQDWLFISGEHQIFTAEAAGANHQESVNG